MLLSHDRTCTVQDVQGHAMTEDTKGHQSYRSDQTRDPIDILR